MSRFSLICLFSALVLAGCDTASAPDTQSETGAEVGSDASDATDSMPKPGEIVRDRAGTEMIEITLTDPQGNTLSTADLKGKPVLMNLWATFCVPCKKEMPLLDNLADELGDDVRVLTVSQDSEGKAEKVAAYFAEAKFRNLEQWLDPRNDLGVKFADGGLLPTTILFDAQGKELLRVAGDYAWDSEDAIAAVREAIAASDSAE